ncbi:MAG TPA: DUF5995 family protein [Acidimicrobiia bacterium]
MKFLYKVAASALAVTTVAAFGPVAHAARKKPSPTGAFTKAWGAVAPTLTGKLDPKSRNVCNRGEAKCVQIVADEMRARSDALAARCDHAAPFITAYLLETQQIAKVVETTFDDPAYLSHLAAVFGKYYFDAYDNWRAGRTTKVPPTWQTALDAARNRQVFGMGDILLGINSHITRDLPFVLEQVGLTTPSGASRKPDFEKVNDLISAQQDAVVSENARRFDPAIGAFSFPALDVDEKTFAALVINWREESWRNAERLIAAKTSRERTAIAQEIEDTAVTRQVAILGTTTYLPFIASTNERDAYCQQHHNDQ